MHRRQQQLLCPVPEETCGCWEVLCWSVVPEEPLGCPACTGTDPQCPGCQACVDSQAGASASAAAGTAAVSLPGQPWGSIGLPRLPGLMCWSPKGLQRGSSGWRPASPHHGWCFHLTLDLDAPSLLLGRLFPYLYPESAFSIRLAGGSRWQSLACPIAPHAGGSAGGRSCCVGDRTDGGGTGGDTEVPRGVLCSGSGWYKGCLEAPVHCWHGAGGLGRDGDVAREQRSGAGSWGVRWDG